MQFNLYIVLLQFGD